MATIFLFALIFIAPLFTHSLGLLFIFLFFAFIFINHKSVVRNSIYRVFLVALIPLAFAMWRFAENYFLFGSPIGDSIPIYKSLSIDAALFERGMRGMLTPVEFVLKGPLKGFFDLKLYSLPYWFALAALLVRFREVKRNSMLLDLVVITAIFYLIVIAGTLAGSQAMVINPRYLLTVQPMICALGAVALTSLIRSKFLRVLILAGTLVPTTYLTYAKFAAYLPPKLVSDSDRVKNSGIGVYQALNWIENNTAKESVILTFRMADFLWYSSRKIIRHFDPRLESAFKEQNDEIVWEKLRDLGVDYIFLPNYTPPTIDRTAFGDFLASDRFTDLVFFSQGNRIFRLAKIPNLDSPAPLKKNVDLGALKLQTGFRGRNVLSKCERPVELAPDRRYTLKIKLKNTAAVSLNASIKFSNGTASFPLWYGFPGIQERVWFVPFRSPKVAGGPLSTCFVAEGKKLTKDSIIEASLLSAPN